MAIKHFEDSVSDTRDRRTLNVAGVFATESSGTYTPADAFPGQLAVESALYPSTAYAGKNNPNTWYMVAANATTALKDLYVASPDVASTAVAAATLTGFNGNVYDLGQETFGVPAPAGIRARYIKVEEGSLYTWYDGWFATAPTSTNKYCTINANGLWAPASAAPQSGFYLEILETVAATVGAYAGATGYYGKIKVVA